MADALQIRHDASARAFEVVVDGLRNDLSYRLTDGVMHIVHTGVAPELQGRGIAAALVRDALDWARASGMKVNPVCSYVRAYMRRHPETAVLRA
jgi:hypothetical protein